MLLEAELARAQHPLPQVRRAEVRRDGPREGPDGLPAAGREPARRGRRHAAAAAAAGHRAGQGAAVDGRCCWQAGGNFDAWAEWKPPAGAAKLWPKFVALLQRAGRARPTTCPPQVHRVRKFYAPLLEAKYDHVEPRLRDLEQLELIASRYRSRPRMLLEMTLDPPSSTQDLAGPPVLDDDYLVLSTIHSAKGLEWDAVYVIHAADGNIPSDMATKNPEEIEEERRLFYVALTRAKNWLYVCYPLRYYWPGRSDHHTLRPAHPLPARQGAHVLRAVRDRSARRRGCRRIRRRFRLAITSRSVRRRTKDLWG